MQYGLEINGDRKAILRFQEFPQLAHDRIYLTLQDIERRMEALVLAAEPEKTGALRSMTGGRVYDHDTRIAAVVGVRASNQRTEGDKARALEYGSHKSIAVRAHQASLGHVWGRAIATRQFEVAAHTRTTNVAARRFLRDSIDAIRADAIAELRAAVDSAVTESNAS